jgi:transposase
MKTLNRKTSAESQELSPSKKRDTIKLGIDWHAGYYKVVRMIDEGGPERPSVLGRSNLYSGAEKQLTFADKVYSCYEAGAGGYVLHRALVSRGVNNVVVVPRIWTPRANRCAMTLARPVNSRRIWIGIFAATTKPCASCACPQPEQEQKRQQSRQRQQMQKHRLALASQGRSLLLAQGWRVSNNGWRPRSWPQLRAHLPEWIARELWMRMSESSCRSCRPGRRRGTERRL